jgi:hypothetical protein
MCEVWEGEFTGTMRRGGGWSESIWVRNGCSNRRERRVVNIKRPQK